MAWRAGAELFREIWPVLERYEPEGDFRRAFTVDLIELFLGCDVDPTDIKGLHPEVDAALEEFETRRCEDGLCGESPAPDVALRRTPRAGRNFSA
jgi:hypothetical protein